jgi:hypothetical protein
MFAPRRLCVYPPPLRAPILSTAGSPLSPLFPLDTSHSPASLLFPLHTQIQGGRGSTTRTISSVTFNFTDRHPTRKTPNHYRFSYLSNKCRRADIPVSGIPLSPSSIFDFACISRVTGHESRITRIVGAPTFFNRSPNVELQAKFRFGWCRTYGAWRWWAMRTQRLPAGLVSCAPLALHEGDQPEGWPPQNLGAAHVPLPGQAEGGRYNSDAKMAA